MHPEWAGPGESGYQVANWAAPARWGPRVYERLDLGGVIHPQTRPSQFAGEEYTPRYAHPRARPAPSPSFFLGGVAISPAAMASSSVAADMELDRPNLEDYLPPDSLPQEAPRNLHL